MVWVFWGLWFYCVLDPSRNHLSGNKKAGAFSPMRYIVRQIGLKNLATQCTWVGMTSWKAISWLKSTRALGQNNQLHPHPPTPLLSSLEVSPLILATTIKCYFQLEKSSGWHPTIHQKICRQKFIINNLASKNFDYVSVNCYVESNHLEWLQSP